MQGSCFFRKNPSKKAFLEKRSCSTFSYEKIIDDETGLNEEAVTRIHVLLPQIIVQMFGDTIL